MTNQEAFDKVYEHLLSQYKVSIGKDGMCMYRQGGLKCAIGCLIPDELYSPDMESQAASDVARQLPLFDGLNRGLLDDLQVIHDDASVENWKTELYLCARKYNLSVHAVK